LNYNILLTASSDTILARKRELDEEGIKTINAKIDYLASKKGYTKILNESTPQGAVYEILSFVFEKQHKKNLKRLK
jgi:Skp family chaperone for outer membrane proteins